MAKIYRAPEKTPTSFKNKTVFLAGSIDMGKAKEWQTMLEEALNKTDVTIFNPRRLDFDPKAKYKSDNPYMVQQIKWELSHLDKADIIVFYFDPNGEAPITLYEMGRVSRDVSELKKKGLIYCPEGYWKKANVDVNGEYDFFNFAETEEELIEFLKQMIKGDL